MATYVLHGKTTTTFEGTAQEMLVQARAVAPVLVCLVNPRDLEHLSLVGVRPDGSALALTSSFILHVLESVRVLSDAEFKAQQRKICSVVPGILAGRDDEVAAAITALVEVLEEAPA